MAPRDDASCAALATADLPLDASQTWPESKLAQIPPPELSIKAIREAIPAHCFERSFFRSFAHLLLDLMMIGALGFAIWTVDSHPLFHFVPRTVKTLVAWPLYMWWQGAVMTGVWVLAHECGHQSFSTSRLINDTLGLILHSALLVPYHSWRITHGQHHKATNHMDRDQVFVPLIREEYVASVGLVPAADGRLHYTSALNEALEQAPIGDLFNIVKMLTLGWPAYLTFNVAGQKYPAGSNHFNPHAAMFSRRDFWDIVISDVGILAGFGALGFATRQFGLLNVVRYYFVPYLFVNMWLVLITYLQHSDPTIPHYDKSEWNFVRGALCSVDRDYGVYNILHHHIGDTHVAHHLFSQMPFYHAQEATAAIRKVCGQYYRSDKTPIFEALLRSFRHCKYVDPADGSVMYYRRLVDTVVKPM